MTGKRRMQARSLNYSKRAWYFFSWLRISYVRSIHSVGSAYLYHSLRKALALIHRLPSPKIAPELQLLIYALLVDIRHWRTGGTWLARLPTVVFGMSLRARHVRTSLSNDACCSHTHSSRVLFNQLCRGRSQSTSTVLEQISTISPSGSVLLKGLPSTYA